MELGIGYLTEKVEEIGVFKEERRGGFMVLHSGGGAGLLTEGRGGGLTQVDIRSKAPQG